MHRALPPAVARRRSANFGRRAQRGGGGGGKAAARGAAAAAAAVGPSWTLCPLCYRRPPGDKAANPSGAIEFSCNECAAAASCRLARFPEVHARDGVAHKDPVSEPLKT